MNGGNGNGTAHVTLLFVTEIMYLPTFVVVVLVVTVQPYPMAWVKYHVHRKYLRTVDNLTIIAMFLITSWIFMM